MNMHGDLTSGNMNNGKGSNKDNLRPGNLDKSNSRDSLRPGNLGKSNNRDNLKPDNPSSSGRRETEPRIFRRSTHLGKERPFFSTIKARAAKMSSSARTPFGQLSVHAPQPRHCRRCVDSLSEYPASPEKTLRIRLTFPLATAVSFCNSAKTGHTL